MVNLNLRGTHLGDEVFGDMMRGDGIPEGSGIFPAPSSDVYRKSSLDIHNSNNYSDNNSNSNSCSKRKDRRRSTKKSEKDTYSTTKAPARRGVAQWNLIHLLHLDISHCSFSSHGVSRFAEKCTSLMHLDLSGLALLTDAGVAVVVGSCKKLTRLWMDDCPLLTNCSVVELAYSLPDLLSLHLSSSLESYIDSRGVLVCHRQYTDDALESILDGARSLQVLSLSYFSVLPSTCTS
jgi:hypothetical protein